MDVALRLVPFFLLVLAGAVAARTNRIDLAGARALSAYVFWIAFPSMLIHNLSTMPAPDAKMGLGLVAYCVAMVIPLGLIVALGRLLGWNREARLGAGAAAMAGNIAFLTGPFALTIFGPASAPAVAAVIAVDTVIIVAISAAAMRAAAQDSSWKRTTLLTLGNPLVLGAAIGAAMSYSGYVFAPPLEKAMGLLGSTASPVGLVALGVVVGLEFGKQAKGEIAPVVVAAVSKLVLAPLLVWFAIGLIPGTDPVFRAVATLAAGAPAAVHVFIQTRTLGIFAKGGAMTVVLTTLAAAVSLSVLGGVLVGWVG